MFSIILCIKLFPIKIFFSQEIYTFIEDKLIEQHQIFSKIDKQKFLVKYKNDKRIKLRHENDQFFFIEIEVYNENFDDCFQQNEMCFYFYIKEMTIIHDTQKYEYEINIHLKIFYAKNAEFSFYFMDDTVNRSLNSKIKVFPNKNIKGQFYTFYLIIFTFWIGLVVKIIQK